MVEYWKLVMIPVIGFLIGYFTNYLAVKMLFYPRKKILGFQGVLPSRKKDLARNIGSVSINFLPDTIQDLQKLPMVGDKIAASIKRSIEKKVKSLDDVELERLILQVISKELSFITWIGGLLGFLIGIAQIGLLYI